MWAIAQRRSTIATMLATFSYTRGRRRSGASANRLALHGLMSMQKQGAKMSNSQNDRKGHTEHNKGGHQPVTQKNEPKRTPESRHDRESQVGGGNQAQVRKGATPTGH
jgi:hypothetical protein